MSMVTPYRTSAMLMLNMYGGSGLLKLSFSAGFGIDIKYRKDAKLFMKTEISLKKISEKLFQY